MPTSQGVYQPGKNAGATGTLINIDAFEIVP